MHRNAMQCNAMHMGTHVLSHTPSKSTSRRYKERFYSFIKQILSHCICTILLMQSFVAISKLNILNLLFLFIE